MSATRKDGVCKNCGHALKHFGGKWVHYYRPYKMGYDSCTLFIVKKKASCDCVDAEPVLKGVEENMSNKEFGRPTKFYYPESIPSSDMDFEVVIGDQDTDIIPIRTTYQQIRRFVEYIDAEEINAKRGE